MNDVGVYPHPSLHIPQDQWAPSASFVVVRYLEHRITLRSVSRSSDLASIALIGFFVDNMDGPLRGQKARRRPSKFRRATPWVCEDPHRCLVVIQVSDVKLGMVGKTKSRTSRTTMTYPWMGTIFTP